MFSIHVQEILVVARYVIVPLRSHIVVHISTVSYIGNLLIRLSVVFITMVEPMGAYWCAESSLAASRVEYCC